MKTIKRNMLTGIYVAAFALLQLLVSSSVCRASTEQPQEPANMEVDSLAGVPTHNPDGVEIPTYVRGQIKKYNALLLSHADVTLCPEEDIRANPGRCTNVLSIEATKKETRITIFNGIGWNWNWGFTDKGTCLIDPATGDRYMIRDIEGKAELGRLYYFPYTLKGKAVLKTMIFPPLKKNVETVDIYYPANFIDVPAKDNGTGGYTKGVVIKDYPAGGKKKGEIIR